MEVDSRAGLNRNTATVHPSLVAESVIGVHELKHYDRCILDKLGKL